MSVFVPLKEKAEVRAATCSSLISAREFNSSSVSPSEKYSCSLSPLMFTKGSTAIECGGGAKVAWTAMTGAAGGVGGDAWCFENLSMAKYARAPATTKVIASIADINRQEAGIRTFVGVAAADTGLADSSLVVIPDDGTGDT